MLNLGVKSGDYIMIGDHIKIWVVKEKGDIRCLIDAPRELKILRGQLYEEDKQKKSIAEVG